MNTEIWKSITGYEGIYEISNLGRVKSLKFDREKILKPMKNKDGYLQVDLFRNGNGKFLYVHRLVATAFLPNPEGFEQINHKDEVKINNFVFINEDGSVDLEKSNIEWCSAWYNTHYGTHNERSAAKHHALKTVEASKYSDFREICLRFSSTREADRNGYKHGAVSSCCRGCYSTHRGNFYKNLYWRFAS